MVITAQKGSGIVASPKISSFSGHDQALNLLDMPLGMLIYNENMEYKISGSKVYLRTRRGNELTLDILRRPYGCGSYIYNRATEFLIWVDGTDLKYYDYATAAINPVSSGTGVLTSNSQAFFVMYGQGTNAAMYGVNGADAVIKISGSTPTYSSITSVSGMKHIAYSSVAGRLFGVLGHTIYYTQQQAQAAGVSNLENWNVGTNNAEVTADDGVGFLCSLDMGQAHFFWKDTGIWCLLNGNLATTNWSFPKCNADIGTLSPYSVQRSKYGSAAGAIYLGSDVTLRFFNGFIEQNAGNVPTLRNGDSKIISEPFQKYLDLIPKDQLSKVYAVSYQNYYILCYPGKQKTDVTEAIFVDTSKLMELQAGQDIQQPFWFRVSHHSEWVGFSVRQSTQELYGFNRYGYIANLLQSNIYVDQVPSRVSVAGSYAIKYEAVLGWFQFFDTEVQMIDAYFIWATTGSWSLNARVNAFRNGDPIPEKSAGTELVLSPQNAGSSYFNSSYFGSAHFAGSAGGLISQASGAKKLGHWFNFAIYNNNSGEWAEWYGVAPVFRQVRTDFMGLRG